MHLAQCVSGLVCAVLVTDHKSNQVALDGLILVTAGLILVMEVLFWSWLVFFVVGGGHSWSYSGHGWSNSGHSWANSGHSWSNSDHSWSYSGHSWSNSGHGWSKSGQGWSNSGHSWSYSDQGWSNSGHGWSNSSHSWSESGQGWFRLANTSCSSIECTLKIILCQLLSEKAFLAGGVKTHALLSSCQSNW